MIKLLLVDDDEDILQALHFFLKKNKFDVVAVANGGKVIETAVNSEFDIILMDVNLSGYDGREICSRLRSEAQLTIPIVLFSAISEYEESIAECGADGFLSKPIEIKHFVHHLYSYFC